MEQPNSMVIKKEIIKVLSLPQKGVFCLFFLVMIMILENGVASYIYRSIGKFISITFIIQSLMFHYFVFRSMLLLQ